jgi:DNA-binding FadR family transcriptional regulator
MKSLRSIEKVRVFDQAKDQIGSAILNGEWVPGSKIPSEQELCEMLAVGRSTIREALRVLEAEGLIEIKHGTGAYVADRSQWGTTRGEVLAWLTQREDSIIQILEIREFIEGLTASLAAKNMPREVVETLKTYIKQMSIKSTAPTLDTLELADMDVRFHLTISEYSNNDIANDIVNHIIPTFAKANRAVLLVSGKIESSIAEHRAIVEAIESGNAGAAEDAMRNHISRVRRDICAYLREPCADE